MFSKIMDRKRLKMERKLNIANEIYQKDKGLPIELGYVEVAFEKCLASGSLIENNIVG